MHLHRPIPERSLVPCQRQARIERPSLTLTIALQWAARQVGIRAAHTFSASCCTLGRLCSRALIHQSIVQLLVGILTCLGHPAHALCPVRQHMQPSHASCSGRACAGGLDPPVAVQQQVQCHSSSSVERMMANRELCAELSSDRQRIPEARSYCRGITT